MFKWVLREIAFFYLDMLFWSHFKLIVVILQYMKIKVILQYMKDTNIKDTWSALKKTVLLNKNYESQEWKNM